jgi:ubiquinone/menaquinone biosynthesis C-methylase UbiE
MMESHPAETLEALKSTFAQYWDQRSSSFDDQPQHICQSPEEAAAWKEVLGKLTSGARGLVALDVGTGTGFLAFLLAEMGHQVVGIDLSIGMLAQARAEAVKLEQPVHFLEADAENTGFPDHTFDLVVSRHVIWNLPQPKLAIAEWARVTRPGGVVAVINGIFSGNPERWGETYRAAFEGLPLREGVTPERISRLMEQAGLSSVEMEWLNALMEIKRRNGPEEAERTPNQRYLVKGTKPA